MNIKYVTLFIAFALIYFLNSCSCNQWFNNGCTFKETWIGKIIGGK